MLLEGDDKWIYVETACHFLDHLPVPNPTMDARVTVTPSIQAYWL
jgi:hypothetical protein